MFFQQKDDTRGVSRQNRWSDVINQYRKYREECCREDSNSSSSRRISRIQGVEDLLATINETKKIIDLVYAYEPLCYYFGLVPEQFWNNRIKENIIYVQSKMAKKLDELREQVNLFEVATNKLIKADAMSSKYPEIINIKDFYSNLFENENNKTDDPQKIANFFYSLMKSEREE